MNKESSSDPIHFFHSEYRKTGIALCLSLAAFAGWEGGWFYSFHGQFTTRQSLIWSGVALSALFILLLSILVQCLHYFGLRFAARYYADQENKSLKIWSDSILGIADTLVIIFLGILVINIFFALMYIALYAPPGPFGFKK